MENSDIKVTEQLGAAVKGATSIEDIRSLLMAEATRQGIVAMGVDGHLVPASPSETPKVYTRTEIVGGKSVTISASSQEELDRKAIELFKTDAAHNTRQPETTRVLDPVSAVDLELKFKRGEITAADYIERSGAVSHYMEKQGISLSDIKRSLNDVAEISWQRATDEFLTSAAGSDWPGGQKNLEVIGLTLQQLGLVDAEDKTAALAQAWQEMKKSGAIFEGVAPAQVTVEKDATPEEIMAAYKARVAAEGKDLNSEFMKTFSSTGSSSSLFGR